MANTLKKKKKIKPEKSSKVTTKGKFNYEQVIAQMILDPVSGPMGVFLAIREAINNALDAGATQILILFEVVEGFTVFTIIDNGKGFTQKGINSVMSYAYSARERNDVTTIGANGTGVKNLLALGDYTQTEIRIETINSQLATPMQMVNTYDYVVKLAKKKVKADDFVSSIKKPKNWEEYMPGRTTGTTVRIFNADKRKIRERNLADRLSEVITPRAANFVKVFNGTGWVPVNPLLFRGMPYNFEFEQPLLGKVSFDLFYGGGGEGPKVCGPTNEIQPFADVMRRLTMDEKKSVSKVWKTISGHIYIERGNVYRLHNNTFGKEFFESEAVDQFFELLNTVGVELEKLNQQKKDTETLAKREEMVVKIIAASKILNPGMDKKDTGGSLIPKKPFESVDQEVCIVPTSVTFKPNQSKVIKLFNRGTKVLDFSDVTWSIKGKSAVASIIKQDKGGVSIKAGTTEDSVELIAKGSFGTHTVTITIATPAIGPHIQGAAVMRPGSIEVYGLYRYPHKVGWMIEETPKGIEKGIELTIQSGTDTKQVSLSVAEDAIEGAITLVAHHPTKKNEIVAKRKIVISRELGNKDSYIEVNGVIYRLVTEFHFPNTLVQIDHTWGASDEVPSIVINPLHDRVKNLNTTLALDHYLAGIAQAALVHQLELKRVKATDVAPLAEDFIATMKPVILNNDREEVVVAEVAVAG